MTGPQQGDDAQAQQSEDSQITINKGRLATNLAIAAGAMGSALAQEKPMPEAPLPDPIEVVERIDVPRSLLEQLQNRASSHPEYKDYVQQVDLVLRSDEYTKEEKQAFVDAQDRLWRNCCGQYAVALAGMMLGHQVSIIDLIDNTNRSGTFTDPETMLNIFNHQRSPLSQLGISAKEVGYSASQLKDNSSQPYDDLITFLKGDNNAAILLVNARTSDGDSTPHWITVERSEANEYGVTTGFRVAECGGISIEEDRGIGSISIQELHDIWDNRITLERGPLKASSNHQNYWIQVVTDNQEFVPGRAPLDVRIQNKGLHLAKLALEQPRHIGDGVRAVGNATADAAQRLLKKINDRIADNRISELQERFRR